MTTLSEVAPERWDDLLADVGVQDVYFRTRWGEALGPLDQR